MQPLSIQLPEKLALASQEAAKAMGISRSEFIRKAIIHELKNLKIQLERESMIEAFEAMKEDSSYYEELANIDIDFAEGLVSDKDEWWIQKKS